MIRIEFEEPNKEICSCCNNEIIKLTRFVFKNDDAFAIYYLKFTKGHEDKYAIGIISIGDWGTDQPKNRFAFPFRIWTNEGNYQVGLMDKEDSPWKPDSADLQSVPSTVLHNAGITNLCGHGLQIRAIE